MGKKGMGEKEEQFTKEKEKLVSGIAPILYVLGGIWYGKIIDF